MSQPLPVCTAQRARATKGRCVPPRCPDRQTERRMCMHLAASLAAGMSSLRGRGSSGVTLARPGRGGFPPVLPKSAGHPRGTSAVAPAAGERWRSRPALRPARSPPGAHPREPQEAARAPTGRSRAQGWSPPAAVMQRPALHPLLEESLESYLVPVTFLRSPSHQGSASSCFSLNYRIQDQKNCKGR